MANLTHQEALKLLNDLSNDDVFFEKGDCVRFNIKLPYSPLKQCKIFTPPEWRRKTIAEYYELIKVGVKTCTKSTQCNEIRRSCGNLVVPNPPRYAVGDPTFPFEAERNMTFEKLQQEFCARFTERQFEIWFFFDAESAENQQDSTSNSDYDSDSSNDELQEMIKQQHQKQQQFQQEQFSVYFYRVSQQLWKPNTPMEYALSSFFKEGDLLFRHYGGLWREETLYDIMDGLLDREDVVGEHGELYLAQEAPVKIVGMFPFGGKALKGYASFEDQALGEFLSVDQVKPRGDKRPSDGAVNMLRRLFKYCPASQAQLQQEEAEQQQNDDDDEEHFEEEEQQQQRQQQDDDEDEEKFEEEEEEEQQQQDDDDEEENFEEEEEQQDSEENCEDVPLVEERQVNGVILLFQVFQNAKIEYKFPLKNYKHIFGSKGGKRLVATGAVPEEFDAEHDVSNEYKPKSPFNLKREESCRKTDKYQFTICLWFIWFFGVDFFKRPRTIDETTPTGIVVQCLVELLGERENAQTQKQLSSWADFLTKRVDCVKKVWEEKLKKIREQNKEREKKKLKLKKTPNRNKALGGHIGNHLQENIFVAVVKQLANLKMKENLPEGGIASFEEISTLIRKCHEDVRKNLEDNSSPPQRRGR